MGITTLRKRHGDISREDGVTKAIDVVDKKVKKETTKSKGKKATKKAEPELEQKQTDETN